MVDVCWFVVVVVFVDDGVVVWGGGGGEVFEVVDYGCEGVVFVVFEGG